MGRAGSSSMQRCHRRQYGEKGQGSHPAACSSIPLHAGHLAGVVGRGFLPVSRLSLPKTAGGLHMYQPAQLGAGVLCPTSPVASQVSSKARVYTTSSKSVSPSTSSRTTASTNTSYSVSSRARANDRAIGKSRAKAKL